MYNSKNWINVAVKQPTHKKLLLFKIKSKARNLDAVINKAINILKKYERGLSEK